MKKPIKTAEIIKEIIDEIEILHDQIKVGNIEPLRGILDLRAKLQSKYKI